MTDDELRDLERRERELRYGALNGRARGDEISRARDAELDLYRLELGDDIDD